IIGSRWSSRSGRVYLDVTNDADFAPATSSEQSSWNTLWQAGRQIYIMGESRNEAFNNRHVITGVSKHVHITGGQASFARAPTATDDSTLGYTSFGSYWQDTTVPDRRGRYTCVDASVGAAVWVKSESIWEIDFNGRRIEAVNKGSSSGY